MPVFECPHCGKRDLVPLAFCEWMLDRLPPPRLDAEQNPVYSLKCPTCSSNNRDSTKRNLPDHEGT